MMTQYFTFGQNHAHRVNGKTSHAAMVAHFGQQWAMQYDEPPTPEYYPRGVIDL